MSKILIIGGGAMGSAFSIPCLENKNKVHVIYDTPAPDTIQKMMQKPEVQEVMKNAGNKVETMVVATCTD